MLGAEPPWLARMDGELEVGALTVRPALNDLARALDSLRARLDRWGQGYSRPTPSPRAIDDTRMLEIVEEILTIPVGVGPEELFGRAMDRAGPLLDIDRSMLLTVERGRLVPR